MGEVNRREWLKGLSAAGAAAVSGVGTNAEAGRVSRDAVSGIRGEIRYADPASRLNKVVDEWTDTFLLKDRLFIKQMRAVLDVGRPGEVKYDIRKKEDGKLIERADDKGVAPHIVLFDDCYALIQKKTENTVSVEVGLIGVGSGKRTIILTFTTAVPQTADSKKK